MVCVAVIQVKRRTRGCSPLCRRQPRSGANAKKDFVIFRNGPFEILDLEDLSRLRVGVDGGFHVRW